jgi:hypothetical protein
MDLAKFQTIDFDLAIGNLVLQFMKFRIKLIPDVNKLLSGGTFNRLEKMSIIAKLGTDLREPLLLRLDRRKAFLSLPPVVANSFGDVDGPESLALELLDLGSGLSQAFVQFVDHGTEGLDLGRPGRGVFRRPGL